MARGISKDGIGGERRNEPDPWERSIGRDDHHYEALVEVANGSQLTVRATSMSGLIREAQNIIGRDLRGEKYYVRQVSVDGRFDVKALNELMAGLRG